jgi:hypothetical protein
LPSAAPRRTLAEGWTAMPSSPSKDPKPQPSKVSFRARADGALEILGGAELQLAESGPSDFHLATGADARRLYGDLAELRALRLKQVGGSVYKRAGSRFWQMQYLVDGKWRQESTHTESKRDAEALLREKVYLASAGALPGTVSFEQIIDAVVDDARVRGRKFARLAGAARGLKVRLEGYRAEDCNYAVWLKYARERQQEVAADTVHLELVIAKRAYKLARANGLVSHIPDFPPIGNLRVRQGFVDPRQWTKLRAKLRPDFRDAADFAFLCGAREMETLTLKWDDVESDPRVIHLRVTKSGQPRAIPYAEWPELAAVIERRAVVAEQLKRTAVITPRGVLLQCAGHSPRPSVPCGRPGAVQSDRTARLAGSAAQRVVRGLCERGSAGIALSRSAPLGRSQLRARRHTAQRRDEAGRLDRQDLQPLRDRRRERDRAGGAKAERVFEGRGLTLF